MGAAAAANGAKYECLLFDMDDTLYPMSTGLNLACRRNIQDFMLHQLGIEEGQVPRMCLDLYREYGTTMAGLKNLGYEFDNDEFHAYVHGRLPYETLKPDPILRNLLLSMPQRKIIFTNADKAHAAQILSRLGLEDCFQGVICFETLNPPPPEVTAEHSSAHQMNGVADRNIPGEDTEDPIFGQDDATNELNGIDNDTSVNQKKVQKIICKPSLTAMQAAIRIANVDPSKTIFFDDSARNIATAKLAGLHTVIVGSSDLVPGADYASRSIHNMKETLPQIWECDQEEEEEEEHLNQIIQPASVETVVLA